MAADDRPLLIQMLSMVTTAAISGVDDNFAMQLNGTKQLQRTRRLWMLDTCRLTEYLARHEDGNISDNLLEACSGLGDRLLSWSFKSEKVASIARLPDANDFNHHAQAWNYVLLYYYRRIWCCDAADLVEEVDRIPKHLCAAEDVKAQSNLE
ncbi:hypothetical protein TruAng_001662 [Truncatella angustata]|nr:hypothetical protein TruAng_001662 [Truncatella angustata]